MVIDLDTERRNGLDESQLAEQVMLLLVPGWQSECNGPWRGWHDSASLCRGCDEVFDVKESHKRVPKPLREVRDELLGWIDRQGGEWAIYSGGPLTSPYGVTIIDAERADVFVNFTTIADAPLALALGAIRLRHLR